MRFPKVKLTPRLLKLAYRFVDVEASSEAAPPDGRMIEYSFVLQRLSLLPLGRVLDVGCTSGLNYLPSCLAWLGWEVWGIDLREFKFRHPNFHFVCGDITHTSFTDNFFDHVYEISVFEHVGLGGRYGIRQDDPEGDFKAVKEISRILRPGGRLFVTEPFAEKERLEKPWGRVYDRHRLRDLFADYEVLGEAYYVRNSEGYWDKVSEETAAVAGARYYDSIILLELMPVK